MEVINLSIDGLKIIKPRRIEDERGFFMESYKKPLYFQKGIKSHFIQDNCSFSCKNTLRGMHFQSFPGQDKLVWVSSGKVFDVAVDIRKNSPTFGSYECVELDAKEGCQFFIPKGFAHGFLVLSSAATVHYKVSAVFDASTEKGFCFNDPYLSIPWPIKDPILSKRDQESPKFQELFG